MQNSRLGHPAVRCCAGAVASLLVLLGQTAGAAGEAGVGAASEPLAGSRERGLDLEAGDYVWWPQRSASGPVVIAVSLADQLAHVYRNDTLVGISTISTGRPGYRTPVGVYTILQKRKRHFSNLYENAPMPFMQRLTWDGIALHGGDLPGYPASHGCIRLPHEFARLLYGETTFDTVVVVSDAPTTSPEDEGGLVLSHGVVEHGHMRPVDPAGTLDDTLRVAPAMDRGGSTAELNRAMLARLAER